jgi:hypothetical protein
MKLLYFNVFLNTTVFYDIQHGAAFEPFVERISGKLVLRGCIFLSKCKPKVFL